MKKWKCTVCGYIHEGEQPPEKCPVCGADKSLFILLDGNETQTGSIDQTKPIAGSDIIIPGLPLRIIELISEHHLHPISVHIPNGVLPITVLFAFLAVIFQSIFFKHAASANMTLVFLAMPAVFVSGYIDWKRKYRGHLNRIFITKMICAAVVTITSLALAIWWMSDPEILNSGAAKKFPFLLLNLIDLGAAGTAGFLGGKIVFQK